MTSFLTSLYSWASWLFTFGWEPVWFENFWRSSDFVIRWFVFQTAWNCFDNLKEGWAGNLKSSLPVETSAQGSGVKKFRTELSWISPRACGTNMSPFCFGFLFSCCVVAVLRVEFRCTWLLCGVWSEKTEIAERWRVEGWNSLFPTLGKVRREAATAVGVRESFV